MPWALCLSYIIRNVLKIQIYIKEPLLTVGTKRLPEGPPFSVDATHDEVLERRDDKDHRVFPTAN